MAAHAWAALQLVAALLALLLALWRPRAVQRSFARQGIRGPRYRFLVGSLPEAKRLAAAGRIGVPPLDAGSHDIMPILLPTFSRWVTEHGRTFLHWIGPTPAIFSSDLQLVKQVLTDRTGLYQKDFMIPVLTFLLGNGLILINGDDWKRHRKVILPAFNHEKLKIMSAATAELVEKMTRRWRDQIQQSGDSQEAEIDVNCTICDLIMEIIGRVAFGTGHQEADKVSLAMQDMQKLASAAMLDPPILWHLPTQRNLRVRRMDKQLRMKITAMMQARVPAKDANSSGDGGYGNDLLGLMLEAWSPERQGSGGTLSTQEVIVGIRVPNKQV